MKFYRGSAAAARSYVEADRARVDDYYLAEGTGLATHYVATPAGVAEVGSMDGPAYERWVAGYDVETGQAKGRLRHDDRGLRFVEVVVNGPKTWSLAASLHPEIAQAYDKAQDRAAAEIIGWLAEHATTRVGPRGRQVQVPVERLEAAVVRHYTSRAGDPHRHLHLQVNSRVFAAGRWRGLHSVGVVDSIGALNGIGHAAVMCDPQFRSALATYGYRLEAETGEIIQLSPYVGPFSARAAQISLNVDRYEAQWRTDHPDEEPGAGLRPIWDRRAWAQARPDKVVPKDGTQLTRRWREELWDLGFTPPTATLEPISPVGTPVGRVDRDEMTELVVSRLGARRSSWNSADILGEVERLVAAANVVTAAGVRRELVEDLTHRAAERCVPLLTRHDVPEHVRSLTSRHVLDVEADLITRLAARAEHPGRSLTFDETVHGDRLDSTQQRVVGALAGTGRLLVVEGAAGSGKTTTLAAAKEWLEVLGRGLVVVTPTLKAARVAQQQVGATAFSAAWLVHQYGYRWDDDGRWTRVQAEPSTRARLRPRDLLLIDEAGMLDQDAALALLTIADETGARIALAGDRHQLPAVGRGGVLDLAARWARPETRLELDTVHRFTDPEYAQLSLLMRTGERSGEVFDALVARGQVVIHHSQAELTTTLTTTLTTGLTTGSSDGLVIADTREQVAALNAAIRDHRLTTGHIAAAAGSLTTNAGEQIGIGDKIATRRNDPDLGVANRDTWTVTGIGADGTVLVRGRVGARTLPRAYVREHVELAYATTVYGAQGETVHTAHLVVGDTTGAAAAYVGMTRGRTHNTAHLVAENLDDARAHWIEVFGRDRADLGPGHATTAAIDAIDRYGPNAPQHPSRLQAAALRADLPRRSSRRATTPRPASPGIDF